MHSLLSNAATATTGRVVALSSSNGYGGTACLYISGIVGSTVTIKGAVLSNDEAPENFTMQTLSNGTFTANGCYTLTALPSHIQAVTSGGAEANGIYVRLKT